MHARLKHLVIHLFLSIPGYASADLPQDADRSIDVELAGFLYSQGIYRTVYGTFKEIGQASGGRGELGENLTIPGAPTTKINQIENWLNTRNATISVGDFFDE